MIEDNNNNLIWLDLEMTGLGDEHVILEAVSYTHLTLPTNC